MKLVIFAVFVMIAMALTQAQEKPCSPLYKLCYTHSDCCRFTQCATYQAKCVPTYPGVFVPGQDKRPLGPGPYPPNVPKELLVE